MPTVTIRRTWKVDGVLTNVTTALLSDPTGTYGIKRNDTDATVVADATAMTNVSTGVYEYTFSATAGLSYTAYVEFVYAGATYHLEHDIPTVASTPTLSSSETTDIRHLRGYPPRTREQWTLQDALHHLLDTFSIDLVSKHSRLARRAVIDSYRDLPYRHAWSYYQREGTTFTSAQQTDGTAAYDHSTRTVTLDGATFPANSEYRRIVFNTPTGATPDRGYQIERVLSSTTATLRSDQNPGDDLDAQSYILYQAEYPLPFDFRQSGKLTEVNRGSWPSHLNVDSALNYSSFNHVPQAQPLYYSIVSSTVRIGEKSLYFRPPPSVSRRYDYIYDAQAQPYVQFGSSFEYATGTVSRDATTHSQINGTGTAWTQAMVGCMIRVSSSTTIPTGLSGTNSSDNPYSQQFVIQEVVNGTTLYVDRDAEDFTGKAHSIGSPIDIEHGTMLTCFLRLCELRFARMLPDRAKMIGTYQSEFMRELSRAKAADYGNNNLNRAPVYQYNSLKDLA